MQTPRGFTIFLAMITAAAASGLPQVTQLSSSHDFATELLSKFNLVDSNRSHDFTCDSALKPFACAMKRVRNKYDAMVEKKDTVIQVCATKKCGILKDAEAQVVTSLAIEKSVVQDRSDARNASVTAFANANQVANADQDALLRKFEAAFQEADRARISAFATTNATFNEAQIESSKLIEDLRRTLGNLTSQLQNEISPRNSKTRCATSIGYHNSYYMPNTELLQFLQAASALNPELLGTELKTLLEDAIKEANWIIPSVAEQLEDGLTSYEFDVFADPDGGRYAMPLSTTYLPGLEAKYTSDELALMKTPGFKTMKLQDFAWRSSCLTLATCLELINTTQRTRPIYVTLDIKTAPVPGWERDAFEKIAELYRNQTLVALQLALQLTTALHAQKSTAIMKAVMNKTNHTQSEDVRFQAISRILADLGLPDLAISMIGPLLALTQLKPEQRALLTTKVLTLTSEEKTELRDALLEPMNAPHPVVPLLMNATHGGYGNSLDLWSLLEDEVRYLATSDPPVYFMIGDAAESADYIARRTNSNRILLPNIAELSELPRGWEIDEVYVKCDDPVPTSKKCMGKSAKEVVEAGFLVRSKTDVRVDGEEYAEDLHRRQHAKDAGAHVLLSDFANRLLD